MKLNKRSNLIKVLFENFPQLEKIAKNIDREIIFISVLEITPSPNSLYFCTDGSDFNFQQNIEELLHFINYQRNDDKIRVTITLDDRNQQDYTVKF